MKSLFYISIAAIPAFLPSSGVNAQGKYGADSIECVKNISLYREFYQQKNYQDALPYWRIIFNTCPASTEHMYADGPVLMRWAMDKEKDPARKSKYKDSILAIYDQRIVNFGKEGYVLGRKMMEMATLYPDSNDAIYRMGNRAYEVDAEKMDPYAAMLWLRSAISLIGDKKLPAEEGVAIYGKVVRSVSSKATEYYLKSRDEAERIFATWASCDILIPMYEAKFKAAPDNVDVMKDIVKTLGEKCPDTDIFLKATTALDKAEPSAESAFGLGRMHYGKKNFPEAARYYQLAIDRETSDDKKAGYYFELAVIQASNLGNPSAAKANAQKAASLRSGWGQPYLLIGQIIAGTKDCGDNEIAQKSVFWLAVDKFQHAKAIDPSVASEANEKITLYSKYFPTVGNAHFYSIKEGQEYTVPCFGETTKARLLK